MYYDTTGQPITIEQAGRLFQDNAARRVRKTHVQRPGCAYVVSTVFLVIDHRFGRDGSPVLWETMVFAEDDDGKVNWNDLACWRASSREEAIADHERAVRMLEEGLDLAEWT